MLAERPGNRRADGFLDLLTHPQVGLLLVVPGRGDTLRVNGRATLVRDAPFLDDLVVQGHRPVLALVVDVEEVFFHCSKAFLRAGLWDPATWDPDAAPSRRIAGAVERPDDSPEELAAYYGPSYGTRLYGRERYGWACTTPELPPQRRTGALQRPGRADAVRRLLVVGRPATGSPAAAGGARGRGRRGWHDHVGLPLLRRLERHGSVDDSADVWAGRGQARAGR